MSLTLPIARTWDGAPAETAAAVQLADAGDHLLLRVLAPWHRDPPPPGPPGPTWQLWDHEVVELFVAGPDDRYLEVEVGPHGHHLVLTFASERRETARLLPLDLVTRRCEGGADAWAATARIPRALLPPGPHRVNAYRIHGPPHARRHLAHAPVPGERPDFHRLGCFVPAVVPQRASPEDADLDALVAAVTGSALHTPPARGGAFEARALAAWVGATTSRGGRARAD